MRTEELLINKEQTGRKMHALIGRFARDLENVYVRINGKTRQFSRLDPLEVHTIVKNIPYKKDTAPVEVVARPSRLLNGEFSAGLDCKKKAIIICAWAKPKYPYRLVASSRRADLKFHHVFPMVFLGGQWVNFDATYSNMQLGAVKQVTKAQII